MLVRVDSIDFESDHHVICWWEWILLILCQTTMGMLVRVDSIDFESDHHGYAGESGFY